jgi:hypothetical protein
MIRRFNASLIAIEVELKYRYIARSLSVRDRKGDPSAPIDAKSEIVDLLRRLKLNRQSDSSLLAIGVELEYRSIARLLFGCGPKGEPNAPIVTKSELADFLRRRCSCSCSSGML